MKFTASTRKAQGTGASRRLRRADKLPGIVYGGKVPATPIELDHNEIFHALRKEKFHASILDMELDGQNEKVLLRAFQMHPYKPSIFNVLLLTNQSICTFHFTSSAKRSLLPLLLKKQTLHTLLLKSKSPACQPTFLNSSLLIFPA